jgi:hypothetical protein
MTILVANAANGETARRFLGLCEGMQPSTVVIREYTGQERRFLLVNTSDLSSRLVSVDSCQCRELSWQAFNSVVAGSNYGRALSDAGHRDLPLQDAGITRTVPFQRGIDLTVDLCPSHRSLEHTFFTRLINAFSAEEKPVPVAIAVTGIWMQEHPVDLQWLLDAVNRGDLSITWINHSFSHRFDPSLPLRNNFLLEKGTDLRGEILNNEIAMLAHGMIPSVFFRFPGLVSDRTVFDSIESYGLIPVGSDAWLAKGQRPSAGSIVLVHGNGNEPVGIEKFFELLTQRQSDIRSGRWLLFDLRKSVAQEGLFQARDSE